MKWPSARALAEMARDYDAAAAKELLPHWTNVHWYRAYSYGAEHEALKRVLPGRDYRDILGAAGVNWRPPAQIRKSKSARNWTPAKVRGCVIQRGSNLHRIAAAAGLSQKGIYRALRHADCPSAELAIAAFLDLEPMDIWPRRFDADGTRRGTSARDDQREESAA